MPVMQIRPVRVCVRRWLVAMGVRVTGGCRQSFVFVQVVPVVVAMAVNVRHGFVSVFVTVPVA